MMLDALNVAVRPLVTLMLVAVLCWGFIAGKVGGEAFLSVVSMVIGFWFQQRQAARDSATAPPTPNGK